MNNETGVKKGLTTQKCSKTKIVTQTTGTFGWSALKIDVQVVQLKEYVNNVDAASSRVGFYPGYE